MILKTMKVYFYGMLFIVSVLILLQACDSNRVYHQVYTFDNYRWSNSEKLIFEPEISTELVNLNYDLVLNIRYIQGFPYKYLHLLVEIENPDGELINKELSIQIIDDNKQYIGEGAGDYWDLDYKVPGVFQFENSGSYKIEVKSLMEEQPVLLLNEIGISLIKK